MKKVSSSNTKAEILRAYEMLLKELQQERIQNTKLQKEIEVEKSTIKKVEEQSKSGATQSLQSIRKTLNEQLDKIEQGIVKEQEKFQELQQAIIIEKKNLEELYKIQAAAESLDALVITNKQAKEDLEQNLAKRKEELQEEIEAIKTKWKREQEAYEYDLKIKRRNEQDAYQQQKDAQQKELAEEKLAFEKSIDEREKEILSKEEELVALRKVANGFEEQLNKELQAQEKQITEKLTQEFDYKMKLEIKDLESQIKLYQQEVEILKAKINEQQELINSLSAKADNANTQVKDIALKAIENSGMRTIYPERDRKSEDKRGE